MSPPEQRSLSAIRPAPSRKAGRGREAVDREAGQALVELALVITMIMVLCVGAFELGRAAYAYMTVVHAAREGARTAMETGKTASQIEAAAHAAAEPFAVTVLVTRSGARTSVTVSHAFSPVIPFATDIWSTGPLTLTRTLVSQ
jgi:Flp pilus assembly protein TadG